jgi:diguanylate cyclase (GGDEF)-like protein
MSHHARETSGMTSRLLLTYTQRQGGRDAVEAVLRHAGCEGREAELLDERTWFEFPLKLRLYEAVVAVLDDPLAVKRAGEQILDLSVGEGLKVALRALGSPRMVYQHVVRANAKFSAVQAMQLHDLGREHATISFHTDPGYDAHRLDCDYTVGLLSVVPALFGLERARVEHPICAARGHDRCVYEVKWDLAAVSRRSLVLTGAGSAAAVTASALAAPALLPVALGGAAVGAGVLLKRFITTRAAAWRRLEADVREKDEVARRLTASLQDLVSELDLEEVLSKTVDNAYAAVGSKEFVLLVADDEGALRCRATTDVPADQVALIEAWAASAPDDRVEPLLVEDVTLVPALADLERHPRAAFGSLCLTPMRFRGEVLGHLVALAPQARTFLPRELDLVESYALQAAVALTNARLFAAQRELATRDPLTELLNHREFHETLDRELERGRRHGGEFAVALFDLDGFKLVNDSGGHAEGDRILRGVADVLSDACRASDTAFRVGGDEFALVLPATGAAEARAVVDRVSARIARVDARVGTSVGLAAWPADGGSKDVLLAAADATLYAMKRADRRTASRAAAAAADRVTASELHRDRLALAGRLSARLAAVLDAEDVASTAVAALHESFDFRIAYVLRVEDDRLRCIAVGGSLPGEEDVPLWSQRGDQGVSGRVRRTGTTALVHDTELDPDYLPPGHVKPGTDVVLRSQVAVPLRVDGRVWGVLSIQDAARAAFTSDDVLLVETVAAQVAAALQRTALLTRLDPADLARLQADAAGPDPSRL